MSTMAEASRMHSDHQIWITRGHLAALGVATFFIALLAFFVGLRVGQGRATPQDVAGVQPYLPDPAREDALEALLRQVEAAEATDDLSFPEALGEGTEPTPPVDGELGDEAVATAEPDPDFLPEPPAPTIHEPPTSGWAVQVASFADPEEADARIASLREGGWQAYRVAALVNGETWYRARIGGFNTKDEAGKAKQDLEQALGLSDLMIAEAP